MTKLELIQKATAERTLELMNDSIYTMASDVSQLKLDVVTIRDDIAELRQMIRERKEERKNNGKTDKRTQD